MRLSDSWVLFMQKLFLHTCPCPTSRLNRHSEGSISRASTPPESSLAQDSPALKSPESSAMWRRLHPQLQPLLHPRGAPWGGGCRDWGIQTNYTLKSTPDACPLPFNLSLSLLRTKLS